MKLKSLLTTLSIFALSAALLVDADAQPREKRAQTTMKFLSVSTNARATGMGTAITAIETQSSYGQFYNPATMARLDRNFDASFGLVNWIADIDYNMGSMAWRPSDGRYGVFGLQFVSTDYGEIDETILGPGEKGYYRLGTFRPNAWAAGISYARALTGRFSVGANLKYANLDLGTGTHGLSGNGDLERSDYEEGTMIVDFGVHYQTGFESLNFAMSVRNFAPDISFNEEDSELPLTFRIGVAMDMLDLFDGVNQDMHSFNLSIDANRPRDFDEQLIIGGEYTFMDAFSVRGGYGFPTDTEQISAGFGIRQSIGSVELSIDYSYTTFDVFDNVDTFSIQLGF